MSKFLAAPWFACPPRRLAWRLACHVAWGVLLLACVATGRAQPSPSPTLEQPRPASTAGQPQPFDAALRRQLDPIERRITARPLEMDAPLLVLQASTAPGSAERLEVLLLRGVAAALSSNRLLGEQVMAQLQPWPDAATAATAELAHVYVKARLSSARGDVREAKKVLAQIDEPRFAAAAPLVMMRCRSANALAMSGAGDIDQAIVAALQALRLAEQTGQGWRRATALNDLALIYERAEQRQRARQTHDEAMREAELDPDPMLMRDVLTVRGILYSPDPDSRITLDAYTRALAFAAAAGADGIRALGLANLADLYLRQGKYARALQLAQEALPLAQQTRNLSAEVVARSNIGLAKIGLGRVAEGRAGVRAAILLDEQQGATAFAADGWQELGAHLERAGDLKGAIEAHHEYRRLIDQVLREDTRRAVLDAQERYDAEQRSKEIELLNRDNSLKSEQLRARDLALKLWAALAGCVVLLASLMGLAYQRVRKSNQALLNSNETLKAQSELDPLTGLANRRHFLVAIKDMADGGRLRGTVLLIDIDHFKRVNDVHGHAAGDSVLIEVAERLRSALREGDLVVRWGGEEFLIVVKSHDVASAQRLAQRLLDLIAGTPIQAGKQAITVTASLGFATFPVPPHHLSMPWERAIDLVDTVMYMAKAHGRNRAYGIEQIAAADPTELALLTNRMEAAWHAGQVKLFSLHGPTSFQESRS